MTDDRIKALVEAIRSGERADMDGTTVRVSRQAVEEAADLIEAQQAALATAQAEKGAVIERAAQVLLDQPYDVMRKAFDAMDRMQGEGADNIMAAALRALIEKEADHD